MNRTVKSMVRLLEQYRNYHGEWFSQMFSKFLDHCLFYFSHGTFGKHQDEDLYKELWKLLGETYPFEDVLGELYEEINSSFHASAMGQFFTPKSLAQLKTKIVLGDETGEDKNLNIYEPSCGSGVNILASAEHLQSTRLQHLWWAGDLDITCVKMCLIQCCLNTIPAFIYHMNTLTLEIFRVFAVQMIPTATGQYLPKAVELEGAAFERAKVVFVGMVKAAVEAPKSPAGDAPPPPPIPTTNPNPPTPPTGKKRGNSGQITLF